MSLSILSRRPPRATHRIAYGADTFQFGDLRMPPGDGLHPVVIAIHGGFWRARYNLTYFGHICSSLSAQGFATWNIEYRRIGNEGGGWPGTLQDVAAAADFVRELAPRYRLDLSRVVTLGHSAGGQLALWLAGRPRIAATSSLASADPLPIRAAISLAGVVDLAQAEALALSNNVTKTLLGGTPAECPERYAAASPIQLLPLGVRQLLVHGTEDDTVPFALSQEYVAAAKAVGDDATLVTLPGAGHFELVDPTTSEWAAVLAGLVPLLKE